MLDRSSPQTSSGSCWTSPHSTVSLKHQCESDYSPVINALSIVLRTQIDIGIRHEDAELAQAAYGPDMDEGQHARTTVTLPRWAKARQRYSKRQMASISPRLGLLNNLPMTVPFITRLEVFRQFVKYVHSTRSSPSAMTVLSGV